VPPTQFEELHAFNEWANTRLLESSRPCRTISCCAISGRATARYSRHGATLRGASGSGSRDGTSANRQARIRCNVLS